MDSEIGLPGKGARKSGASSRSARRKWRWVITKQLSTSSVARYFALHASGSTRYGLSKSVIESVCIPTPPKPEQTKIAEILSTVDRAIGHTDALIAKQQRIKTGLMQDLLTRGIDEHGTLRSEQTHAFKDSQVGRIPVEWKVGGFENYVVSEAGIKPGPFGSSLTKDMYVEAGYRVYGQEQVIGGTLDIGDYFIFGRKYSEMAGFAVKKGDVLISLVGTIGHVLIIPAEHQPGIINPRLLCFRPDPRRCLPQFLKALLLSQPVRQQLDTFATGGTMPVLSGGIIRKLGVVILDLNEQKRIIQMSAGSEEALLALSARLAKLRSLKTALMQDLLTGKKRVTPLLAAQPVRRVS
jgi:type I restriction enzyme S subunit